MNAITTLEHNSTTELMTAEEQFEILGNRFLSSLDVKENSKRTYKRALKPFFEWINREGITNPTREDVLAYKSYLINDRELSSYTVSNYLVVTRRFFDWLLEEGIINKPIGKVKGAKRSRGFKKDPLTLDQVKELLQSVDRSTLQGKRDYAILMLLSINGLRTIEIIRADIGDIRQQSGEPVLYIHGKGRDDKDEIGVLTHETMKAIMTYLQARGENDPNSPLFTAISNRNSNGRMTTRSVSRIVKESLKAIGIYNKRLTAHSLRHTAVTLYLSNGGGLQEAQKFARHSSIDTTMIYAHNLNRVANAPERKLESLLFGS